MVSTLFLPLFLPFLNFYLYSSFSEPFIHPSTHFLPSFNVFPLYPFFPISTIYATFHPFLHLSIFSPHHTHSSLFTHITFPNISHSCAINFLPFQIPFLNHLLFLFVFHLFALLVPFIPFKAISFSTL